MPAVSQTQQRLFGMALAHKRGELKNASPAVTRLADSMDEATLKHWADTAASELPAKKEASASALRSFKAALDTAVRAGEVARDLPFHVNGARCVVNAGDWHEKDEIAAAVKLAKQFFKNVVEENECGLNPGDTLVLASSAARSEARQAEQKRKEDSHQKNATALPPEEIPTTGIEAIHHALKNLDLAAVEAKARQTLKSGRVSLQADASKTLRAVSGLRRNNTAPEDLVITKVPIIPAQFRPFSSLGGTLVPGDANELAKDLFDLRDAYTEHAKVFGKENAGEAYLPMSDAVKALYGYGDAVKPKTRQRGVAGFMKQITGTNPKFCYDDATEVLTKQYGWVPFKNLPEDTDVGTISPVSLAFEWQRPTAYVHEPHHGSMVRVVVGKCHSRRMDLLVTPNHGMWAKTRQQANKASLTAESMRSGWLREDAHTYVPNVKRRRWVMVAAADWSVGTTWLPDCVKHWDSRVFSRFLGWWLAEGDTHTDGTCATVWQTESNPEYCRELEALFQEISAFEKTSKYHTNPKPDREFEGWGFAVVSARRLVDWLIAECGKGCSRKRIPRAVLDWDKEHLELLWHSFMKGDGSKAKTRRAPSNCHKHKFRSKLTDTHGSFVTTSRQLFDDIMELGFKLGVCVRRRKAYPHLYPPQNAETFIGGVIGRWTSQTESAMETGLEDYNGHVHCCSVPNGLLVVRRNGVAVVSGNSFAQRNLFSKSLDNVGRGVIVVNPDLHMDQIGIPKEMLWTTMAPYIRRRLVRSGVARPDAARMLADRDPMAEQHMMEELKTRPVLYSRAPAWHKFNVVAGYAVPVEGSNIAINPLVTTGMNADFDGDQCINQILACIPDAALPMWRMSYHSIDSHEIRFPQGSSIPAVQDSKIFIFDLEDFPHGEMQRTKRGAKGRIDFHTMPHPIQVLAYDENTGGLKWADVAFWSKHYQREIEIVDTHNGYQLITDDDPRAVYGTAAGELLMQRFTPTAAVENKTLIPRARRIPALEASITSVPKCEDNTHHSSIRMRDAIDLDADTGWMLGAMCGDGWVIKSKDTIKGFALADNDGWNIAKLKRLLQRLTVSVDPAASVTAVAADKSTDATRHGSTVSYRFCGWNVGAWFRSLIGGERDENSSGSANKHLPPFYLSTPEEFRTGLLCGLLDTDGSISVSNGKSKPQLMSSFGSTSIRLCIEVKLLAASLGIFGRITPTETPLGKPCWMVTFSNQDIQRWGAQHMCHADKLAALHSIPQIEDSPVTAKYDIVPVSERCADAVARAIGCPKITAQQRKTAESVWLEKTKETQALYMSFAQARNPKHAKHGAVSRQQAMAAIERIGRDVVAGLPDGEAWLRVVFNNDVTWERVVGVQKTGIKEDGYDLTVPGYETFMSADGVILSNTLNVHVPCLEDSVAEAKEKLLPSKMLFSIKNPDAVVPVPKHEHILGMYAANNRESSAVHQFGSKEEALQAIKTGKVSAKDEVEWPDEV